MQVDTPPIADPTRGPWQCRWFGHRMRLAEQQPPELIHTAHRRMQCARTKCAIIKWSFKTNTQEELDDIMGFVEGSGKGLNRATRRANKG